VLRDHGQEVGTRLEWQTSERNGLAAAFGAPSPVTKREVIFTGISVVILLASITYMAIALG
jgi:hypothetical protein